MASGSSPMSQFKSMLFICPQQCARASFPANLSKDIIIEGDRRLVTARDDKG
jgi:hypothetical protein